MKLTETLSVDCPYTDFTFTGRVRYNEEGELDIEVVHRRFMYSALVRVPSNCSTKPWWHLSRLLRRATYEYEPIYRETKSWVSDKHFKFFDTYDCSSKEVIDKQ